MGFGDHRIFMEVYMIKHNHCSSAQQVGPSSLSQDSNNHYYQKRNRVTQIVHISSCFPQSWQLMIQFLMLTGGCVDYCSINILWLTWFCLFYLMMKWVDLIFLYYCDTLGGRRWKRRVQRIYEYLSERLCFYSNILSPHPNNIHAVSYSDNTFKTSISIKKSNRKYPYMSLKNENNLQHPWNTIRLCETILYSLNRCSE